MARRKGPLASSTNPPSMAEMRPATRRRAPYSSLPAAAHLPTRQPELSCTCSTVRLTSPGHFRVNQLDASSSPHFTIQKIEKFTVIEFRTPSLMDPVQLEDIGKSLYRLIDEEDQRRIVMDFEKVTYLSSQAIGIV